MKEPKKKKASKKAQASFKQNTVKSEKMSSFKYDSKSGTGKSPAVEGHENSADSALKNLQRGGAARGMKHIGKRRYA